MSTTLSLGTPFSTSATRVLFCGAGELGKEVVIEFKRLGCEVIAVDRYPNAPGMQVADRSHVIDMLDGAALRRVIMQERPHLIVPEIEAIATDALVTLEQEGFRVIPTARAAKLTMNREGIRRLAATYDNLQAALSAPDTDLKLFGKPEVRGSRRMGVGLALGNDLDDARAKARNVVHAINVKLD